MLCYIFKNLEAKQQFETTYGERLNLFCETVEVDSQILITAACYNTDNSELLDFYNRNIRDFGENTLIAGQPFLQNFLASDYLEAGEKSSLNQYFNKVEISEEDIHSHSSAQLSQVPILPSAPSVTDIAPSPQSDAASHTSFPDEKNNEENVKYIMLAGENRLSFPLLFESLSQDDQVKYQNVKRGLLLETIDDTPYYCRQDNPLVKEFLTLYPYLVENPPIINMHPANEQRPGNAYRILSACRDQYEDQLQKEKQLEKEQRLQQQDEAQLNKVLEVNKTHCAVDLLVRYADLTGQFQILAQDYKHLLIAQKNWLETIQHLQEGLAQEQATSEELTNQLKSLQRVNISTTVASTTAAAETSVSHFVIPLATQSYIEQQTQPGLSAEEKKEAFKNLSPKDQIAQLQQYENGNKELATCLNNLQQDIQTLTTQCTLLSTLIRNIVKENSQLRTRLEKEQKEQLAAEQKTQQEQAKKQKQLITAEATRKRQCLVLVGDDNIKTLEEFQKSEKYAQLSAAAHEITEGLLLQNGKTCTLEQFKQYFPPVKPRIGFMPNYTVQPKPTESNTICDLSICLTRMQKANGGNPGEFLKQVNVDTQVPDADIFATVQGKQQELNAQYKNIRHQPESTRTASQAQAKTEEHWVSYEDNAAL